MGIAALLKLNSLCGSFGVQTRFSQVLGDLSVFSTTVVAMLVLIASIAAYPTLFFKNCVSFFQKCPF